MTRSDAPAMLSRWSRTARRALADRAGGVMMVTGMALPVATGAAGLAVDVASWHATQVSMQAAADASALSGALEQVRTGSTAADIEAAAIADAARNGFSAANGASVDVAIAAGTVSVTISQTPSTVLAGLLAPASVRVRVRAVAGTTGNPVPSDLCLLALHPTQADAMGLVGNGLIDAEGCRVQVNSSDASALSTTGNAEVEADAICVKGGYSGNGFSPTPDTDCTAIEDPLAAISEPAVGSCDHTNLNYSGQGSVTLSPGVYCGGMSFSGKKKVTFDPGLYVIKGGSISVTGQVEITGEGVTFYLAENARLAMAGGSKVELSAPTAGDTAGLIFFESRASSGVTHSLTGGNAMTYEGTIYLSRSQLSLTGNGATTSVPPVTVMIVRTLRLTGNGTVTLRRDFESSDVPPPAGLVEAARVALIQ